MFKKIATTLYSFLFIGIIGNAQIASILPDVTSELCPNTEYIFEVKIPVITTNPFVFGIAQNVAPQVTQSAYNIVPASNQTIFFFKGKFADYNDKQTFQVQASGQTFDFQFPKIKSLLFQSSSNQIYPNIGTIPAPRCQTTTHNIFFQNSRYGNPTDVNNLIYGTITNYEYLLPAGWLLDGVTSNGTTWLLPNTGNNVTITSNLNTGHGSFILIRASNIICGTGLQPSATLAQILIDRPAPYLYISGDLDICSGFKTYTINGLPTGASVVWTISDPTLASIPNPSILPTVDVTRVTSSTASVILSATVTDCTGSYPAVTKKIFLGMPGYGASYFNGVSDNPVMFYDPNNLTTSVNTVCSEYGPYFIDASPYGTDFTTWSEASGYPANGTLTFSQPSANRGRFYFTSGIAYLRGTVSNSCGSYSQVFAFQRANCLPIGQDPCARGMKDYKLFTISPNPATVQIKVGVTSRPIPPPPCSKVIPENKAGLGYTFSAVNIYNKLGTLVKSHKGKNSKNAILSVHNLIAGTYMVEIISGTYKEQQQIIVQ